MRHAGGAALDADLPKLIQHGGGRCRYPGAAYGHAQHRMRAVPLIRQQGRVGAQKLGDGDAVNAGHLGWIGPDLLRRARPDDNRGDDETGACDEIIEPTQHGFGIQF